ncbi:hypothetical protein ACHAXS_010707 [Conticribra weissflogii]
MIVWVSKVGGGSRWIDPTPARTSSRIELCRLNTNVHDVIQEQERNVE